MRMRVRKRAYAQKSIPSIRKHPLVWLWLVLCGLIFVESHVFDWTEQLVMERTSSMGRGAIQIEQATFFAGTAGEEADSLYALTVTLHNVGDTLERSLPSVYVMENEQPDDSEMTLSLEPSSLYEEINTNGVNNYDNHLCIPPGQTVTVTYFVTDSDYQEIQALRDKETTMYVSLPNRTAKQNVCVPIQWIEVETGEKGGI